MNTAYIPEKIPDYCKVSHSPDGLPLNYEAMIPDFEIYGPDDKGRYLPSMPIITGYPAVDVILNNCRVDDYVEVKRKPQGGKNLHTMHEPITPSSLYNHFFTNKHIAIYPTKPGSDQTSTAVLDFDDHDKELHPDEICNQVRQIMDRLIADGLKPFPVQSGGGQGAHLIMILSRPISSSKIRKYLKRVLIELGYKDGAGGLIKHEIEIFPKQDFIQVGKHGNPIALPYAGESVPLDQMTLVPQNMVAARRMKIELSPAPPDTALACGFEDHQRDDGDCQSAGCLDSIRSRCGFIEHWCKDAVDLSEPEWYYGLTVVGRCKDGVQLCHQYSESYPGYSSEENDKKIEHALTDTGPMTCETICDKTGGGYCNDCQYQGQITSPIQLGYEEIVLDHISELNSKHAAVMVKGKFQIINEETSSGGAKDISFSAEKDFKGRYSNRLIRNPNPGQGRASHISIANAWMTNRHRREYESVEFAPGRENPKRYNLYQGLAVEPVQADWSLMMRHVFEVICNGEKELFLWVVSWMARIVQDPGGERPGTAIALRGKQGTGKGIFVNNFGKIFGSHYLQVTQQDQLVGKFNLHLATSILVFCDEGFWAGNKQAEGALKAIITEPTIMCEPKGVNAFKVDNHINLIMASNNDWVVPAGYEERRFLVLDIAETYQQDHKYFKALADEMDNGGREAMLYDLLRMDTTKANLRQAPKTQALLEQIEATMDSAGKFWFECLESGHLGNAVGEFGGFVATKSLHAVYTEFARNLNDRHPLVSSPFIKQLNKFWPQGVSPCREMVHGKRQSGYKVPTLKECRRTFEQRVQIEINWGEE